MIYSTHNVVCGGIMNNNRDHQCIKKIWFVSLFTMLKPPKSSS